MPATPGVRDAELERMVLSLASDLAVGQMRALARAVSLLESGGYAAARLMREIYAKTGRARLVGVTGPPGAGKSTLVDRLARQLRQRQQTVGVLAVDPTSAFTGGALLGDRIRMQGVATDPGVFIRSMATRGTVGGLARATSDAADLLDAAGFDWVLVETVGVGQDEIDVVRCVDTVIVVMVPGLGDEIQTIKAGIMEVADVFAINKADRPGIEGVEHDLRSMLAMSAKHPWRPPVVRTIGTEDEGTSELLEAVEEHRRWLEESDELDRRRYSHFRLRVESILEDRILAAAAHQVGFDAELRAAFESREDPYRIADRLFADVMASAMPEERR